MLHSFQVFKVFEAQLDESLRKPVSFQCWLCFEQGAGLDSLLRSLPNCMILWLSDFFFYAVLDLFEKTSFDCFLQASVYPRITQMRILSDITDITGRKLTIKFSMDFLIEHDIKTL